MALLGFSNPYHCLVCVLIPLDTRDSDWCFEMAYWYLAMAYWYLALDPQGCAANTLIPFEPPLPLLPGLEMLAGTDAD